MGKQVFIGWSGDDNQEIARLISNRLSGAGYSPIVGGEWQASFTVSEEIIHQMNGCDYAIFLIEKEERRNDRNELLSKGLNPNVMMELGYLLHKVSDPHRIRRILINMEPNELPSDLQGVWTEKVKKDSYEKGDEAARLNVLSKVADEVSKNFFTYIEKDSGSANKLDYFDKWEEYSQEIYHYTGDTRIANKLIYGMQVAIYSGDIDRLYNKLTAIRDGFDNKNIKDRYSDRPVVLCARAVLNVFAVTRRLTRFPTQEQFDRLCEDLEFEYEREISDPDLKTWCRIFRTDKLELAHEFFAAGQEDPADRIDYYEQALELCHEVLQMIDDHVNEVKRDETYALIYRAFASRNISQIHKQLGELEPEKAAEHLAEQKKYCAMTLGYRKELYDYYMRGGRGNGVTNDIVSQEFLLAQVEQYHFEEKRSVQIKIERTVRTIYRQWEERNAIRNMILEKVRMEAADILDKM